MLIVAMNYLTYIVISVEIIAALAATFYFYKYKNTTLKWLLPLLWYIPANEIFCNFIVSRSFFYPFYNLYDIIVSVSILLIIKSQLRTRVRKKILRYLIIACLISFIINMLLINPLKEFTTGAFTFSACLIVVALLYYLIELLKIDEILNPSHNIFLWISAGFLIFHISYPILYFSRRFLNAGSLAFYNSLDKLHVTVVVLSYKTITFGFFWGKKMESAITN
ncbi:hypothetical protein EAX61_14165 [Dokdonia sinensis]|uniref:Uncharacterized protein n=1 Tax=Dokdonia sinensis TaxID=2479847 RepID=A0A3M0FUT3_9FLAO|nr:hypothetical protein EAX61_14165 [Dokdonia sinensis]